MAKIYHHNTQYCHERCEEGHNHMKGSQKDEKHLHEIKRPLLSAQSTPFTCFFEIKLASSAFSMIYEQIYMFSSHKVQKYHKTRLVQLLYQ
jgi:hypothetical protein